MATVQKGENSLLKRHTNHTKWTTVTRYQLVAKLQKPSIQKEFYNFFII